MDMVKNCQKYMIFQNGAKSGQDTSGSTFKDIDFKF